MSANVWSRFFWADWLSDPGLRACSAQSRGIWMDLLCVAAAHQPPGYVAFSEAGLTNAEISRLTGEEIHVVEQAISELESRKVFSRTKNGVIYSRRLIREHKRALAAKANGKLGGNPSLRKYNENSNPDNHPPGARARVSTFQSPERILPSGRESEHRSKKKKHEKSNGCATAGSLATALPVGALRSPASEAAAANPKRPHEMTKAEFDAQLEAKRARQP